MSKLYLEAGRVVDAVLHEKLGLKAALYRETSSGQLWSDARVVCKLASATLGYRVALQAALRAAGLRSEGQEPRGKQKQQKADDGKSGQKQLASIEVERPGMALVMAYDLLIGRGLKGGGRLSRVLKERKSEMQSSVTASLEASGKAGSPSTLFAELPRYLRINRLRVGPDSSEATSVRKRLSKALAERQQALASKRKKPSEAENGESSDIKVEVDPLVPNVLLLPSSAKRLLHDVPLINDGDLVMQDRSSCLSALSAGIRPGTVVLDSCSAPGSKTAHAIELLEGQGRLIACERNPRRAAELLKRLRLLTGIARKPGKAVRGGASALGGDDDAWFEKLDEASLTPGSTWSFSSSKSGAALSSSHTAGGGASVELHVGDFLECDPEKAPYRDVEVLIVDPSCSGSGLPEHHMGDEANYSVGERRLRQLAAFQKKILGHALRFPKARTVCYSTCSTHRVENEDVVASVLRGEFNNALSEDDSQKQTESSTTSRPRFKVVEALPYWQNAAVTERYKKGLPLPSWQAHCLRCDPAAHKCRGFFLCRLDRVPEGVDLPILSPRIGPAADSSAHQGSRGERQQPGDKNRLAEPAEQAPPKKRRRTTKAEKKASAAADVAAAGAGDEGPAASRASLENSSVPGASAPVAPKKRSKKAAGVRFCAPPEKRVPATK